MNEDKENIIEKAESLFAQLQSLLNNKRKHDAEDEEEKEEEEKLDNDNEAEDENADDEDEENEEEEEEEEKEVVKKVIKKNQSKKQKDMIDVEDGKHLMEKYAKLVTKKSSFGKGKSWYTLKLNTIKDCSTAKYYVVQMEFSNDEEDEQLNIWLKGTYIHDVLKSLVENDPDCLPLFNGFHDVILNAKIAEIRVKPYGVNEGSGNKKDGFTYKEYMNYYLIPREMGSHKATVEKFKNTMIKILNSNNFFAMMTVYQNQRMNRGGRPGNILRDTEAELWKQLGKEDNNKLNFMNSLNAKFLDDDIKVILNKLFGKESDHARNVKIGWHNDESNPFKTSKKK